MLVAVKLWDMAGTSLVVHHRTGVVYENQVGGTSCEVRELEGYLLPIANDVSVPDLVLLSPENALSLHFQGPPHSGAGATRGIRPEDADTIEAILGRYPPWGAAVRVSRDRLHESCEAWIHVDFLPAIVDTLVSSPSPDAAVPAVLTWTNSD